MVRGWQLRPGQLSSLNVNANSVALAGSLPLPNDLRNQTTDLNLGGTTKTLRPIADGAFCRLDAIFKFRELTRRNSQMRVKDTLNIGKTKFPMRGRLPETEAQREKLWEDNKVYEQRQKLNQASQLLFFTMASIC